MKCEETRELLDAFHDGELQPATRAAVETHLRSCPSCSAALLLDFERRIFSSWWCEVHDVRQCARPIAQQSR